MARQATELASWRSLHDHLGPDYLRIASYNIHRCVGADRHCNAERVAHVISELGCDTIGLQEVDNQPGERHDSMQLNFLANATRMEAVAGLDLIRHEGHFGNALLTARKVLAVARHDLSYARREPRGALEVMLDIQGKPARVIVTHLGLRPAERRYQVRRMLRLLRDIPHEQLVVVLGDINEWLPLGRPLRWMHGMLGRAPAERSFPVWFPAFALDRVWVRPRGALIAFGVHRSEAARRASDHLPVKAIISTRETTHSGMPGMHRAPSHTY